MFSPGTRVSVLTSGVTGKKLESKPYSLGYINISDNSYLINEVKDFPHKKQSFIVTPLSVIFTRYGREQRRRLELRGFLNILPVFTNSKGIDIRARISEIHDMFSDGELTKNSRWHDLANNFRSNNVGVILPIRHTNVERIDYEELKPWASSIIRSPGFGHALKKNKNLPTLRALHTARPELFGWVIKAVDSSDSRYSLFSWAAESDTNFNNLIHFMRVVSTCVNKRAVENSITSMTAAFEHSPENISTEAFATWFTNFMFDGDRIMNRKHQIANAAGVHKTLKEMTDCMRVVRSTYLQIKPKHI